MKISLWPWLLPGLMMLLAAAPARALEHEDGFIRHRTSEGGQEWTFGTATVERTVAFEDGHFVLKQFNHGPGGQELIGPGSQAEEFSYQPGAEAPRVSSAAGGWSLADWNETRLEDGRLQLQITLAREGLQVTKTYMIHPHSSVIREWVTFKNAGTAPAPVFDPAMLELTARTGDPAELDFYWIAGGACLPGTLKLRHEKLAAETRRFDSYDPFPKDPDLPEAPRGDGVLARILLNDAPAWPPEGAPAGWQESADMLTKVPFDLNLEVKAGDRLVFLVNMNKDLSYDTTAFNPTIAYEGGATHAADKEFGPEQGANGWRYQYIEGGVYKDLKYYNQFRQWRLETDNASGTPFVGPDNQHPHPDMDVARVWTAPQAGKIHVSGMVCNTGNPSSTGDALFGPYGFRPGSSSYCPWFALLNKQTQAGVFVGWDYFGHWTGDWRIADGGAARLTLAVAGYKQTLAPGESFSTPKAFTGLFREDLDNAGNECLDWQYGYLWGYAREGWYPAIRVLGYWWQGTGWRIGQLRGYQDVESTYRKVFRLADYMRQIGADVYHRDWGWWDKMGDWNGPDWMDTGNYLRKQGMGQLIYTPINIAQEGTRPHREHPEYLAGESFDTSIPAGVDHMGAMLDDMVRRWGPFQLRMDSAITFPVKGDDTPMIAQDEGFRRLITSFMDRNPGCAFQACNGGGNFISYEYISYASTIQMTDGAAGILSNYYATLMFPPDRMCHMPDTLDPDKYDAATWMSLLTLCFDTSGESWNPDKVEGMRQLVELYKYLHAQGVAGRWSHIYRPRVEGDDPTMFLQRLSRDARRGVIVIKHQAPASLRLWPKGLVPGERYDVTFHKSPKTVTLTGADLMREGLALENAPAGELVYLNLPLHPGNTLDKTPPAAPATAVKRRGENMGQPGVEIEWDAATDDQWVSRYELLRDGQPLDTIAKGRFFFDHSAGADLAAEYAVRTVDGAGNRSELTPARGEAPEGARAQVFDDAQPELVFSGAWQRVTGEAPAHLGTLTAASEKGAPMEARFTGGTRALLYVRLGAAGGKASVSLDDAEPRVVDTYSADSIWGYCAIALPLSGAGEHTLRVEVLGEHGDRNDGTEVCIDGLRIEMDGVAAGD